MRTRPPQVVEHTLGRLAVGYVEWLARQVRKREGIARLAEPEILREEDTDYVVEGFLVNRILFPYTDEAVRLVLAGVPGDAVDREAARGSSTGQ